MKRAAIERELDIALYPGLVMGSVGVILFYTTQVIRSIWILDPLIKNLYLSHALIIIPVAVVIYLLIRRQPRDSGRLHAYAFAIAGLLVAASLHTVIATAEPLNALGLLVIGLAVGSVMNRILWFTLSFGLVLLSYLYVDWFYAVALQNPLSQATAAYASITLTIAVFVTRHYTQLQTIRARNVAQNATHALESELDARVNAENNLRAAQERLEIVMNQVPIGIFWKDREHRYLGCNQQFADFHGADSATALTGKTDIAIYSETDFVNCVIELENHIMETGDSSLNALTHFRRKNGKLVSIPEDQGDLTSSIILRTCRMPLHDSEGRSIGVLGTVEDVTEQVRAQAEEAELDQKFLNAQKFESLGALSGGIAHEFNNILVGVLGNADFMRLKLDEDSKLHKNLAGIIESAQRASQLVQQMLLYSGRREIQKGRVNINQLIRDLDGIIRASVSKRVTIRYELEPDLPSLTADGGQLRQMLVNLLMNASEAMQNGDGVITVRTGVSEFQPEDLGASPRESVFIEVADNGCGMDDETSLRIFDPFFTTKFMGRGLGMSAVRGIVHAHDGKLTLTTVPGEGTTVRIDLRKDRPATEEEVVIPEPAADTPVLTEGTALLIDDEEMVVKVATYMLEAVGYHVESAPNGEAGLKLFDQHRDDIRLLMIDRTMPGLSGEEVVAAIRQRGSDVPVILCSGYSDDNLAESIRNDRMTTTLQKPFSQADIEAGIRALAVVQ